MSTLMEDLIILAVGLKPKAGPNTGVLPPQFRFGVRGGELVMLTMAGRVVVANGRIEVRDPTPLADEASNAALSKLVASGGADVGQWMVNMPPMHVTYHFELLRAAGALSPVQVRLLLIAKRTGYLMVDQAYFRDVRARLHAAVTSPGPIDESQAALTGVVYAAGLARFAYPGSANTAQRDRLEQLAGGSPASRAAAAAGTGTAGPRSTTIRTASPSSTARPAPAGEPRRQRSRRPCGLPPKPRCTRLSPRSPRRIRFLRFLAVTPPLTFDIPPLPGLP